MKRILSSAKALIILLVLTVMSLGFYAYMLVRPISYGMEYHIETEYDGIAFEGTLMFYHDGTMIVRNTNFDGEMKSRYYYKEGYVFFCEAQTDEDYAKEVDYINENFDAIVAAPFYGDEINAFVMSAEGIIGYSAEYICESAIVFAVVFGVVELLLIGLTLFALDFRRKGT